MLSEAFAISNGMDELQRKIDAELKRNAAANKKTFNPDQLEDIILTPEETLLKSNVSINSKTDPSQKSAPTTLSVEEPEGNNVNGIVFENSLNRRPRKIGEIKTETPKTIADLLKIEADVAKNPPKATLSPNAQNKLKENLKDISYYPKIDSPIVKRLRTLKGDIEEAMRSGKATLVSMASAEVSHQSEQRQKMEKIEKQEQTLSTTGNNSKKIMTVVVSLVSLLLIIGGGAALYFFNKQALRPVVVIEAPTATAYLPIQFEAKIETDKHNASYLRSAVAAERQSKKGNLNEIGAIYLAKEDEDSSTGEQPLTTAEFFTVFEMRAPEELTRTLSPGFMLGLHRYPENQSFLIFKTDAYESAASGMFVWENNLEEDVGKFLRSPSDFVYATSTDSVVNRRIFKDAVIKNNDARAIYNNKNQLLFFYTFLKDRQTLIMATNPETLGVIITGLSARKLQR